MKSLSIVMPVYNSARHLNQHVEFLVDLLPQVTSRFQLIIVDDGSTDSTGDIAEELSERFTQVEVIYHTSRHGEVAAIDSGANLARYDLVFVQNQSEIVEHEIKELLTGSKLPALKAEAKKLNAEDRLIERLMKWGLALKEHRSRQLNEDAAVARDYSLPVPKYASIAEKRLLEMCQREMKRIDLE